jgi:6-phosphofructokinase
MTAAVEVHDKRFGVVAVEKGFITKEQLFEALKIQVEEDLSGKSHTLIGIILIKLGYLTREEADGILLAMKKK